MPRTAPEQPAGDGAPAVSPVRSTTRARAIAEPIALTHGLEIAAVEWTAVGGESVLRVTIDRLGDGPAAVAVGDGPTTACGVTVDDCARVSRDLSVALDAEDFIGSRYRLEVSSPGMDRPLGGARDFRRHLGKLVKVELVHPVPDGQRVLRGIIEAVDGDELMLRVDGNAHAVRCDAVAEARLVPAIGTAGRAERKPGSRRRKRQAGGKSRASGRKRRRSGRGEG